ncbi:MAG: class I SAM-dependent methyltransferase [Steroidobacteraceae bacterium]|nr:class I SAM-dependent methyltransferase [Steroidobacteraceae bacterium]
MPLPVATGAAGKLAAAVKAALLSPLYLLAAWLRGGPGIGMHLRIAAAGALLLLRRRVPFRTAAGLMLFPMDSTRYFEFAEVWKSAHARSFTRYLDVSSPRWAPLLLLQGAPGATADFINPDPADLADTRALVGAMGLDARARLFGGVLGQAPYAPESFDLITCISVLEHIPEDEAAVRTMWSLLRPGGRLLLTVPCMSAPAEQYISHNQYGVLAPGADGYTFWQRYYDGRRLAGCIYAVTGPPARVAIHGEQRAGLFYRNATMKRLLGARYPSWRESYMMATEYRRFASIEDLPGEGVVMLEFVKPPGGAP